MDKYDNYVHDHFQIFTHIRGLKVRKMCKSSTIQLTASKCNGQKTGRQKEPLEDYRYKVSGEIASEIDSSAVMLGLLIEGPFQNLTWRWVENISFFVWECGSKIINFDQDKPS